MPIYAEPSKTTAPHAWCKAMNTAGKASKSLPEISTVCGNEGEATLDSEARSNSLNEYGNEVTDPLSKVSSENDHRILLKIDTREKYSSIDRSDISPSKRKTRHVSFLSSPVLQPITDEQELIEQRAKHPKLSDHTEPRVINEGNVPVSALVTEIPAKKCSKRKGETDMLTEQNPYGKNPPLPEEVMEALRHLKALTDNTATIYSSKQLDEIKAELSKNRPKWANCLMLKHTKVVADEETEQFIYDLMDKPKYQTSIFSSDMKKCCDLGEYEIDQMEGRDLWTPPQPRRFKNPKTTQIVDAWLDALLDNEKCRVSNASHPAVVTVVEKDGRDPRVCVDYRNRNARTRVPVFPMPDVQDFLDDTAGFQYYCSFDMAKMFTQFKLKEEHRHLAAFITHRGVFEPNVLMFGLAGGPQFAVRECGGAMAADPLTNGTDFTAWAVEQNKNGVHPPYQIDPSTGIVPGSKLKPFIDDVTVPSNHTEGMKKLVELFFEFCHKHGLILSRKKANIMKKHLCMLGFVVSAEGKHLDPARIIKLLEAAQPRSKEALHSLLASFTFIRMFIPNFASIASPLYEATKGIVWKGPQSGRAQGIKFMDPGFIWTTEMTRAYDQLRNALLEAPILVQINEKFALFLSVDASIRGEGWVLWQLITLENGTKVAVAILYGSRKYNDTEKNWETTRQEASAIRSALTDVFEYVFMRHFYLFSDHLNLRFMHNSINRAVLRMRDFLSQFNMTIVHCPGIWNNADSISRLEHDALPSELASDLNSVTEATISGSTLRISLGTSTEEDCFTEGNDALQPTQIEKTVSSSLNNQTAKILCTHCTVAIQSSHLECFLCSEHEIEEEQDDTVQENEISAQCLNTQLNASSTEIYLEEWMEIIPCLDQFKDTDIGLLKSEAIKWNMQQNEMPPLCPEDDESDDEDVEWCDEINRNAVVLHTSIAENFIRTTIPTVTYRDEHPGEEYETYHLLPQTTAVEIKDEHTQTSPSDFRIATIRFPMLEDFKAIHNNESGHHGLDYSYRKLLIRCGSKWANEKGAATQIKSDLKKFVEACPICQKVRGLRDKVKSKHSFIVSRPFIEVSYDFIVFAREDKNGNRYLLVAIDNFLKIVEIQPVKHRDAETVARFLLQLGARYGPIIRLRFDLEGAFTGLIITKLNATRGTEEQKCIAYHPQSNSICERQNGIIMNHLNALILGCKLGQESRLAWSDLVPFVFSLVNTTPKNPLGISPLSMLYGVFANYDQPLLPSTHANTPDSQSNPLDYVDNLIAWQTELLDITERIQSEHFAKLEKKFNTSTVTAEFNVGDFVLQNKKATGISGKPNSRWIGPFLVMDRTHNDVTHPVLHLMNLTDMKVKEASIDDCRQFNTSWFEEETLMPELIKLAATDLNEYVVEKIISHKPMGETRKVPLSKYLFEVKWQDFDETTWEPYSNLKLLDPMEEYSKSHAGLKLNQYQTK
jgi:hypothetical protein